MKLGTMSGSASWGTEGGGDGRRAVGTDGGRGLDGGGRDGRSGGGWTEGGEMDGGWAPHAVTAAPVWGRAAHLWALCAPCLI